MAEEEEYEEIPEQITELNALMKKLDNLSGEDEEGEKDTITAERIEQEAPPGEPAYGDEPFAEVPSEEFTDDDGIYVPSGDTKPIWEHVAEEEEPDGIPPPPPPRTGVRRRPVAKGGQPPRKVKKRKKPSVAMPASRPPGGSAKPAAPRLPKDEARDLTPEQIGRYVEMVEKISGHILEEVGKTVLGKEYVLKMVMTGILSDGHILFEDNPGLAKTLLANTYAKALGCKFRRSQFTPDLLPSDITGTFIFDEKEADFRFRKGPIFTNILLADEINRSPPKTQAALLEAMQEKQVTLEGETMKMARPFIVMATQNPIEYEGTYSLPEAQLDRFLIRMPVGYPSEDIERRILKDRMERRQDDTEVRRIASPETIMRMQRVVERVYVSDAVIEYIVSLVRSTRDDPRVMVGSSPRGSLAIFKLTRSLAAIEGRDYVIPDDVKEVAIHALNHRLILNPEPRIMGVKPEDVIQDIIAEIPVPVVE